MPIKITEAVYTMQLIPYLQIRTHLHFVVSDERIRQKDVFSQRVKKTPAF